MTLAPLLAGGPVIVLHAVSALTALAIGAAQLLAPKGTPWHRVVGWLWGGLMLVVAISSFWIRTLHLGHFSAIHLLSLFTLIVLPVGLLHARRHRVAQHRWTMTSLYTGALIIAGIFTLYPGRIMYQVVFGG